MGLFDRLVKRLTADQAQRAEPLLRSLYNFHSATLQALSYQNLRQLVREGYQSNADVFSVVNWIAEQAAKVPVKVQVLKGDDWIDSPDHPLQKVIRRPNPYEDAFEHRAKLYTFYMITGNAYVYGPRLQGGNVDGQVLEMWTLPAQHVEIITGGWLNPIQKYRLDLFGGNEKTFDFNEVMHLKTVNLSHGEGQELYGMSPLRAGLLALDRSNSNYQASATSFKTMGMAGIISEKQDGLPSALTDEQRRIEEERLMQDYQGVFNYGKTMVTNADITYTRIGLSPVDLNLIADKKATLRDFCNIYNVSSILFNDNENSTYNNMLEAKKSAINDAVLPLVERYINKMSHWILPSYENGQTLRLKADTSKIPELQEDKQMQAQWVSNLVNTGVMKRNEARAELGLPAVQEAAADMLTVPLNIMPLEGMNYDPFVDDPNAQKYLKDKYGIS